MSDPYVRLEGLDMRYPGHHAVKDLNLDIAAGEFIALMGPSGCGKSTTLRMIAGLEQPTGGHILIGGKDMTHVPPDQRGTPMVWQSLALFPFLSVEDNVAFSLKMRGDGPIFRRKTANEWLEKVGLGGMGKRDISQLSGGQRQRVAIARAVVNEPALVLADEPTASLDDEGADTVLALLEEQAASCGATLVVASHDRRLRSRFAHHLRLGGAP
jgi:spermidine/putrescine transport system ATP-binding protein